MRQSEILYVVPPRSHCRSPVGGSCAPPTAPQTDYDKAKMKMMHMSAISAVYFDFGGVFTPSPFAALERLSVAQGARPGELNEIVFGPYEEDTDHPWHRAERGEADLETVRQQIIELGRLRGLDADLLKLLKTLSSDDGLRVRAALVETVRDLRRAGTVRVGLVTNNIREFSSRWRSMLPVDDLFELIVDSSEVGMRKPNPAIFQHALDAFGVEPHQALFLDDHIANVEAATALGMKTIHVDDDEQRTINLLLNALG